MSQLICRNLSFGYVGHMILENLNFQVDQGDYLCIVGENGSGKSTLMKTILGLHKPICGEVVTGDGLKRNEIGYLPQQTMVQRDFPASVFEIVLSGCLARSGIRPVYNRKEKALAKTNFQELAIVSCPADSNNEYCLPERCVLHKSFCCLMSLWLDLTPW